MPSYDQLDNEVWWTREFEPAALARFNSRLRAHYGLTRSQCGSKGDNRHLRGRHRSVNWIRFSSYCTNRTYAATDARDRRGSPDALRATDLGLSGPALWAVCRRVDAAVRAGRLPQLAEWFGTFDGKTVVGWSNGRPSTSDSSHLTHGHFGYWTESADDAVFFDLLFETVTGEDDDMNENDAAKLIAICDLHDEVKLNINGTYMMFPVPITKAFKGLAADLDELKNRPPVQAAPVDAATLKAVLLDPEVLSAIAKEVNDEGHARSAA